MPSDTPFQKTSFLTLKRVQHLGANFIVSGISPDLGLLSFYVRQQTRTNKSAFGSFDLFRLLDIVFRRSSGDLCYCQEAVTVADYSPLTQSYDNFQAACYLAEFATSHILPESPHPRTFQAACVALHRLAAQQQTPPAVLTGFGLTFLSEAGWLNQSKLSARDAAQCQILLEMASGGDMPALTAANWQNLWAWTKQQLDAC